MMKSAFFGGMREREAARSRTLKQTLRLCKFEVKRANQVVLKFSHNIK